ncbi:MAG TPA: 4Fe-4S dicluster domain-containing protein, partial [Terriglobia bacterium]|nr:4Fe-4S dicluster domain-containing protein [Terriglobia bacterium]
ELLSAFLGQPTRTTYEILIEAWGQGRNKDEFEKLWRKSVHDGVVAPELNAVGALYERPGRSQTAPTVSNVVAGFSPRSPSDVIEVAFRPDPTVYDGRFANNGWLQELPKPLIKIVWDNVALLSPATAERLNVINEDVIEIKSEGRAVRAPVWISPGHANDAVTLFLGYGRTRAGALGSNRGYNAYSLRTSASPWLIKNAEVRKSGERYALVSTQEHHSMENRNLVRRASAAEYAQRPDFVEAERDTPPGELTLYPEYAPEEYAWGMSIDLSTCIGCNACVIACQAENNIPVVGKIEAGRSREMHWLRIDRYYQGDIHEPEIFFQPVMCMHCEDAPCEPVCPVAATTHSSEGLNEMTYNRCVGTRYCSNNCPYKVRRFNFFNFHSNEAPSMALLYNPDVTVRSRGVMEKCTYCVQRINHARINAKKEDRAIRDGEVVTACQAACPAGAIVFGNIADPNSRVSKLKSEPRNYGVLTDLNTRPRTTYLAKLTNPNPAVKT